MERGERDELFLKFNNFENGMRDTFKGFKNKSDFCDVTLACEDGQARVQDQGSKWLPPSEKINN